jgi:iron complex transport system permease protein
VVPVAAPSPKRSAARRRGLGILVLFAVAVLLVSPLIGSVTVPPDTVGRILVRQASGGALFPSPCGTLSTSSLRCQAFVEIVVDERVPEILLALLAGAALGISGATLQGIFRNPLADPYLLGISSGGTLGAATLLIFKVGFAEADLFLPLFSFVGALGTGLAILVAARGRHASIESLLLTGVALAAFLSAALSVILLYNPVSSLQVSFWLLGGVGGASWNEDGIAFGGIVVTASILCLYGRELNLLQLGPDVAQSLGVDARGLRRRLLLLASATTAVAVAFTGIIGFVGLVSPHIVRRTVSVDYRWVLPLSALVGGLFLLGARDLSEGAIPGVLLPVGIFTSFAGAPFFLFLLYRQRQRTGIGGP